MTVWLFFYEDEGEDGDNSFTIVAKDHERAYELAFESYGPQVDGMFYKAITKESEQSTKPPQ